MVRDADRLRDRPGALDILFLIRTVTRIAVSALPRILSAPDRHCRSGHIMPGLLQQKCGDCGVDPAAESNKYLHSLLLEVVFFTR